MGSEAYVRGLMGPYGSGKSVGCVMELLRRAQSAPKGEDGVRRTRFVIIRNTYKMLHDTTLNTVFEWVPPGLAGKWVSSRNNYHLQFGDVDSLWMFRALDHPDDIRNLLSLEVTGAWINEYREIDPDVFVNLLGRVGRYRPDKNVDRGWFGIIMDTNPPPVDSFWYSLFEDEPSEEVQAAMGRLNKGSANPRPLLELYKQPSGLSDQAENIENLPEGYYDLLLAANADKSKEWTNVHIHGQYGYVQDGKPVFPEFSDANAATESLVPNPHHPIAIGRDFGLTPAAVAMQQTVDGRWFVLGELVADNCGEEQFVERNLPDSQLTTVADYDEGVSMILENKVDAMVADMPICMLSILRFPDAGFTTLTRPMTIEPIGIAVSARDPQFAHIIDNYIDAFEKTGALAQLRKKWLEDNSWVAALP